MEHNRKTKMITMMALIVAIAMVLVVNTQKVNAAPANPAFDDDVFYKCIVDAYNKENDPDVSYDTNLADSQLQNIKELSCSGLFNYESSKKIHSTKGLEKLTGLINLRLPYNEISTIDVSQNKKLELLQIGDNKLVNLDVSQNNQLKELFISDNEKLTTLNLSNSITSIEVTNCNNLNHFDISKLVSIRKLFLGGCGFLSLDLSGMQDLADNANGYWDFNNNIRKITPKSNGNLYYVNLVEYDNNLDPKRVKFTSGYGINYDKETGMFTFSEIPKYIDYKYITNIPLKSDGTNPTYTDLDVRLELGGSSNYKENSTENDSNKKDNIGTQVVNVADTLMNNKVMILIVAALLIVVGGIVIYIQTRKSKKDKQ